MVDFQTPRNNTTQVNATFADFKAADANLETGTAVTISGGANGAGGIAGSTGSNDSGWAFFSTAQTIGSFAITTVGPISGNYSSAGANSGWNTDKPLVESYIYLNNANTATPFPSVSISGLNALGAGKIITLTTWGIGDNQGQQSLFSASYAGTIKTAETLYNSMPAGNRVDPTGAIPWVKFTFTSTGVDDTISFNFQNALNVPAGAVGGTTANLNGFSLSVVPEPSAILLSTLTLLGLSTRRRR